MSYPTWTLKCNDVEKPLADFTNDDGSITAGWGLSEVRDERVSHGLDKMTMKAVVASVEEEPLFAFRDTAVVYKCTNQETGDKTIWFSGIWTSDPANIQPGDQSFTYELSGPWWYLTQIPYMDIWNLQNEFGLTATQVGILVMGQDSSLARISMKAYITGILEECVAACAAQGTPIVPFSYSVDLVDLYLPFERLQNMTHEQVLIHCLRWYPDSATWFDYSATPPVFHISQRSALEGTTLPAVAPGTETAAGLSIRARRGLVASGVIIQYMQSVQVDDKTKTSLIVDYAPEGVKITDIGVLAFAVDLQAGHINFQKNQIVVNTLPADGPGTVSQWDKDNAPDIFSTKAGLDVVNITVADGDREFDPQDTYGPSEPGCTTGALVGELKNGAMPPQMIAGEAGIYSYNVAYIYLRRTYGYTGDDPKTVVAFQRDRDNPGTITIWYRLAATNAGSGTYQWPTSEQDPEDPPPDLAATLYDMLKTLHYEGRHQIIDAVCTPVSMGNTLNLSGSRDEYTTMAAQITGISYDIDSGKAVVSFGPPKKLGFEDLLDLYRATRIRRPAIDLANRSTGDGSGATIQAHTYTHCTSRVPGPPSTGFRGDGVWGAGIIFKKTGASTWQFKISGKSTIGTSPETSSQLAVAGRDVWADTINTDHMIYLQATVASDGSGGLSSSALALYVGSTGSAGVFDPTAAAWATNAWIEGDGASPQNQKFWRLKICDLDWTSGSPVPVNAITSQLIIRNRTEAGEAAIYPTGA